MIAGLLQFHRRMILPLLVVAVCLVACSPRLNASCGDYLHTRHSSPNSIVVHNVATFDTESVEREYSADFQSSIPSVLDTLHPATEHSDQQAPCNGPQCRQNRNVPRQGPVSYQSISVQKDISPAKAITAQDSFAVPPQLIVVDTVVCEGHIARLFRPPQ